MVERRTNMNEGCLVDDEESVAVSLLSTAESIAIPCSVNAYGMYFRCCPCLLFKVTICDLKLVFAFKVTICDLKSGTSSLVNWNMNRSGKRSMLRFTA